MNRRIFTGAFVVILGCGSPFEVSDDLLPFLRTSLDQYAVVVDTAFATLEIPYEFTNHTRVTVYAGGCLGIIGAIFDRRVDGVWTELVGPGELDCGATPVAVPRGTTLRRTAHARWLLIDDTTHAQAYRPRSIEGELRLRWWQAAFEPFSIGPPNPRSLLPLELSVSNAFRVTEPAHVPAR